MRKNIVYYSIIFIASIILLNASDSSADNEPNNSFEDAETISEGTHSGKVEFKLYYEGIYEGPDIDDPDFYKIEVPEERDLVITAMKTGSEDDLVFVKLHDDDGDDLSFANRLKLTGVNTSHSYQWYNDKGRDTTVFINVSGDGSYTFTVEFTTETIDEQNFFERLDLAIFIYIMCGGLIIAVFAAVLLVIYLKWKKNNEAENKREGQRDFLDYEVKDQ